MAERAGSLEPVAFGADVSAVAIPQQASVGSKTRSAGRNLFLFADRRQGVPMQIIVKGHHAHVTNGLKERATQKVEKVTRLFPRMLTAEIEFTENGGARATVAKHRVEVTLTAKQHTLRATARGPDPLTAMDRVVAKLETQVRRLKGKVTRKGRSGGPGAPSIRTLS